MPKHPQYQPSDFNRDDPIPMSLPLRQNPRALLRKPLLVKSPGMIPLPSFTGGDQLLRPPRRGSFEQWESGKDKDGFDPELIQRTEVRFDVCGESYRKSSGSCDQRFTSER
jgi:hypothetical protein